MANELDVGAGYGARYVVMHIGSHRGLGREEGIERLVDGIARAFCAEADAANADQRTTTLPMLVLENAAGTGDGIGASIEDLADISARRPRPACRWIASASASTRRTCGAPATTSPARPASMTSSAESTR